MLHQGLPSQLPLHVCPARTLSVPGGQEGVLSPAQRKSGRRGQYKQQENYFKVVENEHVYYMCIYLYMYSISVFYSLLITKIDSMNSLDICVHAFVCFI